MMTRGDAAQARPFVVGLTGGISSGKSSVARIFRSLGVPTLDMDDIAKGLLSPEGAALPEVLAHFGERVCTSEGELDRRALRQLIFRDAEAKVWLESLMHPLIRESAWSKIGQLSNHQYVILESPLLLEKGLDKDVDRVLVVDTSETNQLLRTMERDDTDAESAKRIIQQQMSREERLRKAHDVLENNSDTLSLTQSVQTLHESFQKMAKSARRARLTP